MHHTSMDNLFSIIIITLITVWGIGFFGFDEDPYIHILPAAAVVLIMYKKVPLKKRALTIHTNNIQQPK